jgi:hypothetical protein
MSTDFELIGEGFILEDIGETGGEEDRVEREEGGDGGVNLVVLRGGRRAKGVSLARARRET